MTIQIHQLSFAYSKQPAILHQLNLTIPDDSFTLLSGPTGCGKTTLLKLIAGLLPKYGGHITHGKLIIDGHRRIAMLFQDPAMQFTMDTARHELEFTLENLQTPHEQIAPQVKQALSKMHLSALADQPLTTLSGGQLQAVALATTLAMKAPIILLDEPFTNIDEPSRRFLLKVLKAEQSRRHLTVIISDHDLHGYQGCIQQIVEFGPQRVTMLSPLQSQSRLKQADHQTSVHLGATVPSMHNPAFQLTNTQLQREQHLILNQDQLIIPRNEVTLITGPSGCGKSTFLNALSKQLPYTGRISYLQKDIEKISPGKYFRQVVLLFQHTDDQFINVTVKEEIMLSQKHGHSTFFTNQRINEVIDEFGLRNLADRVVYSLSGGQKKLVQILVMLIMGQAVLLMDEPFNGLDHQIQQKLLKLIKVSQKQSPQTLLIVSHQPEQFQEIVQHHLKMIDHHLTYQED